MADAGPARLRVLGLMSGTSVDAVDAALVDVAGSGRSLRADLRAFHSTPVPRALRGRILRACDPAVGRTDLICELNVEIGELFARAALDALAAAGLGQAEVDLIGSHGQTVWHQGAPGPGGVASTLQLGAAAVITERTGITTVADFRPRDMAAGGQGAPLVSYVDWALYRSATAGRALQNIGGIANVTVLPADCAPEEVWAFDSGPGNVLIDAAARLASDGALPYDRDGRLAAAGRPDPTLLSAILAHPFFDLPPPRTTGREQFGQAEAERLWREGLAAGLRPEDVVATCTLATARSIALAYRRWVMPRCRPEAVYVSGGGARNPTLMALLARELPELPIRMLGDLGGDGQAKEALAFAVLAAETLRGLPTSLPGATGARHAAVLGSVVPGANWRRLAALAASAPAVDAGMSREGRRAPEAGAACPAVAAPPAEASPAAELLGDSAATMTSAVPSSARPPARAPARPHVGTARDVAVGVDGGGTKTEAVALDAAGGLLARAAAGPANARAIGEAAARAALAEALGGLLAALPAGARVIGLHAALAGVGRPEDEAPALALLAEVCRLPGLAAALGHLAPAGLGVSNDGLAVLAAAEAPFGVVAIAGTGSLVWGRDAAGRTARAGGWGYLLGDEGSGFDLGRRALAAVLAAHDGRAATTALTEAAREHFGLGAPPELVGSIYGAPDARAAVAGFAPAVLAAATAGDAVAQDLVRGSARDLAEQVTTVARRLDLAGRPFPLVCSGGLFRADAFFAALAPLAGADCRRLERAPAEGAAHLAWAAALARRAAGSA